VSFFQDAASELLYPVLPLFVTGVLGAPPSALGAIEGVAEGTASAAKAVSGRLADRRRRRPLVAAGYGISTLAKPLIGAATGWGLVLVARFGDRLGKGLRTSPRDALIAADTPPPMRGRAFGFHRAADTAGAVVGPLLGLALYEALDHRLRPLFFIAAGPALISTALVWLVKERPGRETAEVVATRERARVVLPKAYWRLVAVLSVFALANFSDTFLILRAKDLGLGFVAIVGAYALYNAVYAVLSYPAGRLSDRVPRRAVFTGGLAAFAGAYVGLGLAGSGSWVWLLLPLYGVYTALTDGVARAWVADVAPPRAVGSGLGYYHALTGVGLLVAGVWAGLAWGHGGRIPLLVSGAAAGVLALALALADRALDPPRG
jgi:MFS family permease